MSFFRGLQERPRKRRRQVGKAKHLGLPGALDERATPGILAQSVIMSPGCDEMGMFHNAEIGSPAHDEHGLKKASSNMPRAECSRERKKQSISSSSSITNYLIPSAYSQNT